MADGTHRLLESVLEQPEIREARTAIAEYIEVFYNRTRKHSTFVGLPQPCRIPESLRAGDPTCSLNGFSAFSLRSYLAFVLV
jgi:hypothetical protein